MEKLRIEAGCITCGVCEFIAPDLFKITDVSQVINQPITQAQKDAACQAALSCPVLVIRYQEYKKRIAHESGEQS